MSEVTHGSRVTCLGDLFVAPLGPPSPPLLSKDVVEIKVEESPRTGSTPGKPKLEEAEIKVKEAESKARRVSSVMDSLADNYLCPIALYPTDPVTAEDGKIYERAAIEKWRSQKATSPSTNKKIGKKLFPAPQAKSTI